MWFLKNKPLHHQKINQGFSSVRNIYCFLFVCLFVCFAFFFVCEKKKTLKNIVLTRRFIKEDLFRNWYFNCSLIREITTRVHSGVNACHDYSLVAKYNCVWKRKFLICLGDMTSLIVKLLTVKKKFPRFEFRKQKLYIKSLPLLE